MLVRIDRSFCRSVAVLAWFIAVAAFAACSGSSSGSGAAPAELPPRAEPAGVDGAGGAVRPWTSAPPRSSG